MQCKNDEKVDRESDPEPAVCTTKTEIEPRSEGRGLILSGNGTVASILREAYALFLGVPVDGTLVANDIVRKGLRTCANK